MNTISNIDDRVSTSDPLEARLSLLSKTHHYFQGLMVCISKKTHGEQTLTLDDVSRSHITTTLIEEHYHYIDQGRGAQSTLSLFLADHMGKYDNEKIQIWGSKEHYNNYIKQYVYAMYGTPTC